MKLSMDLWDLVFCLVLQMHSTLQVLPFFLPKYQQFENEVLVSLSVSELNSLFDDSQG